MNFRLTVLLTAVMLMAACHNPVYDYEGDCSVTYNLRFVYDRNLKWADAFPSEVHSINLYAFNADGVFVKEFVANGEALDQPGYTMQLDLEPGDYQLVAWCGLNDAGVANQSFAVTQPVAGQTSLEQLICSLNTKSDSLYPQYSDTRLNFLYHGALTVNLPDTHNGYVYDYTMSLTKDTNHVRVILQQLSGEDMQPEDFDFRIEDANGVMGHDNLLLGTDVVTYKPWNVQSGVAGIGKGDAADSRALIYVSGVIADLSVSRMVAGHHEDLMLTIYNAKNGTTVARIPIIQYALLSKDYYELAYNHLMSDQEFLDREDEYVLTFFLDENKRWIDSYIYIQQWRIVLHDYEM